MDSLVLRNISNSSVGGFPSSTSIWDLPPEGSFYYKIEGFLGFFYLVHPKRTMYEKVEDVPNFYLTAVELGPSLLAIEFILILIQGLPMYKWSDSLAGFSAMLMAGVPQAFIEVVVFSIGVWIHTNYRIIDLPYDSYLTWIFCLLAADLSMYVAHRLAHEVNFMWAIHQFHHSSEYYNFFSPARNSFLDKFLISVFCLPWSFLLPIGPLKAHHQLNLVYQLWVHTSTIGRLGPLEYIFVTPTQHAIHHGRNRFCIDTNYGGFLSIWDQMFKSMTWPADNVGKKIYYGLVSPVKSWDMIYLYGHHLRTIYRNVRESEGLGNKLSVMFKGPGWAPGKPRLGNIEEIPDEPLDKTPYNKDSPFHILLYCTVHTLFTYKFTINSLKLIKTLPWYMSLTAIIYNTWTVCNICYILEHKPFAPRLEFLRTLVFAVVDFLMLSHVMPYGSVLTIIRFWFSMSVIFWTFNIDYWREQNTENEKTAKSLPLPLEPEMNGKLKAN